MDKQLKILRVMELKRENEKLQEELEKCREQR
jgi:hypothetical protein